MKSLLLGFVLTSVALAQTVTAPAHATKLFAVTFSPGPGWDATKSPADQEHMPEHSANITRMRAAGLSVIGGRYADKGLLVVRAPDEAVVRAALATDPSIEGGTFKVSVDEYRPFQHGDTRPPHVTPEVAVVQAALAAYNQRDATAVAAHYAEDITWFGISADGKQSVEGESRTAIEKWLTGYFKNLPDVRAEIFDLAQTGPHVSFRERVSWTAKDGSKRTQSALGVYEVREGKIKRAWYFPAARETPAPAVR